MDYYITSYARTFVNLAALTTQTPDICLNTMENTAKPDTKRAKVDDITPMDTTTDDVTKTAAAAAPAEAAGAADGEGDVAMGVDAGAGGGAGAGAAAPSTSIENKKSMFDVDLTGKRVLMRVDFNVPLGPEGPTDLQRVDAAIPTIRHALGCGAKSVVLMSHLGRPGGRYNEKLSLKPLAEILFTKLPNVYAVVFMNDCVGDDNEKVLADPPPGTVFLLENLRFHPEEEGKGKSEAGEKTVPSAESVAEFRRKLVRILSLVFLLQTLYTPQPPPRAFATPPSLPRFLLLYPVTRYMNQSDSEGRVFARN